MCERRHAREAQDAAARRLTEACRHMCPDDMGLALKKIYDDTLDQPVPEDLKQLVERLQ